MEARSAHSRNDCTTGRKRILDHIIISLGFRLNTQAVQAILPQISIKCMTMLFKATLMICLQRELKQPQQCTY